jgi:hypothetical protein
MSRAIPLLPFWAFTACSRMNITFTLPVGQESNQYSDPLWAEWSRDRIPQEARFSAPIQTGAFLVICFPNQQEFVYKEHQQFMLK